MYPWEYVTMQNGITFYRNIETGETDVIDMYGDD